MRPVESSGLGGIRRSDGSLTDSTGCWSIQEDDGETISTLTERLLHDPHDVPFLNYGEAAQFQRRRG